MKIREWISNSPHTLLGMKMTRSVIAVAFDTTSSLLFIILNVFTAMIYIIIFAIIIVLSLNMIIIVVVVIVFLFRTNESIVIRESVTMGFLFTQSASTHVTEYWSVNYVFTVLYTKILSVSVMSIGKYDYTEIYLWYVSYRLFRHFVKGITIEWMNYITVTSW